VCVQDRDCIFRVQNTHTKGGLVSNWLLDYKKGNIYIYYFNLFLKKYFDMFFNLSKGQKDIIYIYIYICTGVQKTSKHVLT
jgi:hypothetical protein